MILGIDEAGRGPVIGPLVIAGVIATEAAIKKLGVLGIKDSKQLTPKQREELFPKIKKIAKDYRIITIKPDEIDTTLFGTESNLNWLEADKSSEIINDLKPKKAILDCPSTNIAEYSKYIRKKLNVDTELVAEHKADEKYVIVGAASILAKVTRDNEIEKIKKEIKIDFGSGYPSDPKTKEFLEKNHSKYPDIIRKSWQSYKNIVNAKKQSSLKSFGL